MSIYVPRLTDNGIAGSGWYEYRNPFYLAHYPMPNCTAYAFGRAWELSDPNDTGINEPPLSHGNAEDWYNHADNWARGNVPKLGAIACYADGIFSGDGHVCVVEEIDTINNRCLVSESAYNDYYFRATHYIDYDGTYDNTSGYVFQGFIYNPFAGDTPGGSGRKLLLFDKLIKKRRLQIL